MADNPMTVTRYEILVTIYSSFDVLGNPVLSSGTTYMLDTYDYELITFDSSIAEIQDISQRTADFSKTITVPDTNNNRIIFGYLSDLNVDTDFYNPNKRSFCQILVDTIPVFTGTIQMVSIDYNYETGEDKYNLVFYSSSVNFFKQMGERYLTDLVGATSNQGSTFSYPGLNRYNHTWSVDNVINSWTQSQSNGYYYPLIDYGVYFTQSNVISNGFSFDNINGAIVFPFLEASATASLVLQQMFPAIYLKTIVDEIFVEAGYQYDSTFFNSDFFSNLIVPFNNNSLSSNSSVSTESEFNQPIFTLPFIGNAVDSRAFLLNNVIPPLYPQNGDIFQIPVDFSSSSGGTASFNVQTYLPFPQYGGQNGTDYLIYTTSAPPLIFINSGLFFTTVNNVPFIQNTTAYTQYIIPTITMGLTGIGIYSGTSLPQLLQIQYSGLSTIGESTPAYYGNTLLVCLASQKPGATYATTLSINPFQNGQGSGSQFYNYLQQEINLISNLYSTSTPEIDNYYIMEPGEILFVYLQLRCMYIDLVSIPYPSGPVIDVKLFETTYSTAKTALPGSTINIPANLPSNIKQKDLITNLAKMFNLYIEPNKLYPNILNIEPRDYYYLNDKYSGGVVIKDWTSKIDLKTISKSLLSSTQARTQVFTYKLDTNYYSSYYNTFTNRIPGDKILEIDNDFNTDTETTEIIFSSPVLVNIPGMFNFPVVNLAKQIDTTYNYPVGIAVGGMKILQKSKYFNILGSTGATGATGGSAILGYPGLVNLQITSIDETPGDGWQFATASAQIPYYDFGNSPNGRSGENQLPAYYPYAGNFNNPYTPTIDLNFDDALVNYYNVNTQYLSKRVQNYFAWENESFNVDPILNPELVSYNTYNNNLFNMFYRNQFAEINDLSSVMITCEMYLTPRDIYEFYFNHLIYIELRGQGKYFRVNSIKNYDISGRSTATVELISVLLDGQLPDPLGRTLTGNFNTTTTSSTTTTTTLPPSGTFSLFAQFQVNITNVVGTGIPTYSYPVLTGTLVSNNFTQSIPGSQSISVTLASAGGSFSLARIISLQNGSDRYDVSYSGPGTYNLGLTHSVPLGAVASISVLLD